MNGSGILRQAIEIKKVHKKNATHFVLCNGDRIRYIIDINDGKRRLSGNISTYSSKLSLLMKMLNLLPLSVFWVGRLGYFANVGLHIAVEQQRKATGTNAWNVIVGTYDEKQKIVLQCFNKIGEATFIKIGNKATKTEMNTEIQFLREGRKYETFDLPVLMGSSLISQTNPFNIQITKEFHGVKAIPILTEEIVKIYEEVSSEKKEVNGMIYERSHGDFTPWNLKKLDGRYTLFDWEYTGFRTHGYDLMHFVMTIEIALNGRNISEAFEKALNEIRCFKPDFEVDRNATIIEYKKVIKELEY